MNITPEIRKRLIADLVLILFFALVAFGIWSVGDAIADQTRTFRTDGVEVEVTVISTKSSSARFEYKIDGVIRRGEARAPSPLPAVGDRIIGRYLPSEPREVRIRDVDEATIEADTEAFRMLPLFFIGPLLLLIGARAAQLTGRNPVSAVGPMVGALLLAVVIGVNFMDDVGEQIAARFGAEMLGIPSTWVVSAVEAILLGPLLLTWGSAAITLSALAAAQGTPKAGLSLLFWVWKHPDARKAPGARERFLASSVGLLTLLVVAIVLLSLSAPA